MILVFHLYLLSSTDPAVSSWWPCCSISPARGLHARGSFSMVRHVWITPLFSGHSEWWLAAGGGFVLVGEPRGLAVISLFDAGSDGFLVGCIFSCFFVVTVSMLCTILLDYICREWFKNGIIVILCVV